MSASYDDLSDKIQEQAKEIAELKHINKLLMENKGLVSNYQDASRAVDLFTSEYMGQDQSKLWEWAVSEVRK